MTDTEVNERAQRKSSFLLQLYLRVSQTAYAVIAFPIGTVLSIGPLCLYIDKEVEIETIGFWMAGGELLGIIAMLISEKTDGGFLLKRPYDLYAINIALAFCLVMIPVWKPDLWYMSCFFMMCVQCFNSSSKPVVGESIHRLAVLTDNEPHIVFAEANTLRRIGNATIGVVTPLIFSVDYDMSFYVVGVVMMGFLALVIAVDVKIKRTFERQLSFAEDQEHGRSAIRSTTGVSARRDTSDLRGNLQKRYSTISRLKSFRRRTNELSIKSAAPSEGIDAVDEESGGDSDSEDSLPMNGDLKGYVSQRKANEEGLILEEEDDEDKDDSKSKAEEESDGEDGDNEFNSTFLDESSKLEADVENSNSNVMNESAKGDVNVESGSEESEDPPNDVESTDDSVNDPLEEFEESKPARGRMLNMRAGNDTEPPDEERKSGLGYFLIVLAFPFWDAVVSRLPFAFLTCALVEPYRDDPVALPPEIRKAAGILFGYQIGRAISQWIQVFKSNFVVNYSLNAVAFVGYIAMVIYAFAYPDGDKWFVPIMFTGFAETLPIQQQYMLGLFPDAEDDDTGLRNAVKKSHTSTGVGSMVAFLLASQTFYRSRIKGIAVLGLAIMISKVGTNLVIDYIHHQNEREYERKNRRSMQHYARESMMMVN